MKSVFTHDYEFYDCATPVFCAVETTITQPMSFWAINGLRKGFTEFQWHTDTESKRDVLDIIKDRSYGSYESYESDGSYGDYGG